MERREEGTFQLALRVPPTTELLAIRIGWSRTTA
jgi:hypothetical protein